MSMDDGRSLNIGHINRVRAPGHLEDFKITLHNCNFDIIAISETESEAHLKPSNLRMSIAWIYSG